MSESFSELFENSEIQQNVKTGALLMGTVVSMNREKAIINVGLKSEGFISLNEFKDVNGEIEIIEGDVVEVALESIDDGLGHTLLSREKAKRIKMWQELEAAMQSKEAVRGFVTGSVKGGLTVDIGVIKAFLPGSLVDVRPVKDFDFLIGQEIEAIVIKMDEVRNNIVISRKAVMQEANSADREALLETLEEGKEVDGMIKNLADYGAFIDLGGVDGLLHVTDIAWRRVNHPTDALQIGQTVKVQVIRFNSETQRISLGMKQLEEDPWEGAKEKYPLEARYTGRVTNITDYGAFVELEPGVEGLVHVSEMSWTKKNVHPGKIVSTSQEVEVMVLDVDTDKRRISLGIKQCLSNPWASFETDNPEGTILDGEIKNITEFGLFVELSSETFGMVHLSDIDWSLSGEAAVQKYAKGDKVKVKVLSIDTEKERIGLGIKQLDQDPFQIANEKRGQAVTCTVKGLNDQGVEVEALNGLLGFVRRSDLARDRNEQRPDRFAVGDKFDAKLVQIDRTGRRLTLSIKALEVEEEKQAVEEYGSTDSGASLGDILGAAISRKQEAEALGEDQQEDDVVASADNDESDDPKASQEIITDAVSSKEEEKK
ncbi:MAG: 30S ribosomal protein S1 [Pseudomonadota bacterium]|nr:30S ribosomal protein S1 [Pseudomonadota bacterium]